MHRLKYLLRKHHRCLIWGFCGSLIILASAGATMAVLNNNSSRPVSTPQSRRKAQMPSVSPTSAPLQPNYYVTASQKFLTKAEKYSASPDQTAEDKERILATVQNALTVINQGIRNYPRDDRLYIQRAKIYQGIINFSPKALNNALADLDKARQLSPDNPAYPKKQSQLLSQAGRYQDAAYYANLTYQLEPSNLQNLFYLGQTQIKAGRIKNALQSYQKLLTLLPEDNPEATQVQKEIDNLENLLAQAETNQEAKLHLVGTSPQPTPNQNYIPADIELLPKKEAGLPDNLVIAAPEEDQSKQKEEANFNATAGEATLAAGQDEITLVNKHITNQSQILLSAVSDTQNQNLYVKEKQADDDKPSFTVGIHHPIDTGIEFKWWIVGAD